MRIIYEEPKEEDKYKYKRWMDEDSNRYMWYENSTSLYDYKTEDIPQELKDFLDKWTDKIRVYKESFCERYPVKLAEIEFIYKDIVYSIYPKTVGATYMTDFLLGYMYEVSWDSLFEEYQREMRDDLKNELGVIHSRYWGMLD